MKKTILIFGLMLLSILGISQDCKKLINGKWRVDNKDIGPTYISRENGFQIEDTPTLGVKLKSKVTWISDCKYSLKIIEVIENKNNSDLSDILEAKLIFKVTKSTSRYYEADTKLLYSNGKDITITTKFITIE